MTRNISQFKSWLVLFSCWLTLAGSLTWAQTEEDTDRIAEVTAAAYSGEADAQFELGALYDLLEEDSTAVEWYTKAAEQGHAVSQYNLGDMYHSGEGAPKNDATAVSWYTKAAELGHASAQNNLGVK